MKYSFSFLDKCIICVCCHRMCCHRIFYACVVIVIISNFYVIDLCKHQTMAINHFNYVIVLAWVIIKQCNNVIWQNTLYGWKVLVHPRLSGCFVSLQACRITILNNKTKLCWKIDASGINQQHLDAFGPHRTNQRSAVNCIHEILVHGGLLLLMPLWSVYWF